MMEVFDAATIRNIARLQNFLPYLQEVIDSFEGNLIKKTMTALDKGTLTPQDALIAWKEFAMLRKLVKKFDVQIRVGQSLAQRHSEELEGARA